MTTTDSPVRTMKDQLADAEAQVERLKRQIASGTCRKVGHDWKHVGGRNAACGDPYGCTCSIPVHECTKCGDSDYGDNAEAALRIRACRDEDRARADEDWFFDMDGKP